MSGAEEGGSAAQALRLDPAARVRRLEADLRVRDREERAARREAERLSRQLQQQAPGLHEHARWLAEQEERLAALRQAQERHEQATELQAQVQEREQQAEGLQAQVQTQAEQLQLLRADAELQRGRAAVLEAEVRDLREQLSERQRADEASECELEIAQGELARVRKALENAERQQRRSAGEHALHARGQQQHISALSVGLAQVREDIERAEASRAWRYGHRLTRLLRRFARRRSRTQGALAAARARIDYVQSSTRALPPAGTGGTGTAGGSPAGGAIAGVSPVAGGARLGGAPAAVPTVLAPTAAPAQAADGLPLSAEQLARTDAHRAALAQRLREQLGPVRQREQWPRVSAIVLTRNGRHHLERLFEGLLQHTDYPDLEVIVIDNASSDDSLQYLRSLETSFPLHLIANRENFTFAAANAQGAERANGELLLFLNNDVEAFEAGWLKELVCALDAEGVQAVGATLLHPEDLQSLAKGQVGQATASALLDPEAGRADPGPVLVGPVLVQHRAIRFRWQDGMIKAFNSGDGEELWELAPGAELRAPAVTAACMLIARDSFQRVGGFGSGYRYGTEDVDLGLKLLVCGGESAGVGRAVLVHRESSSQNRESRDFRRLNRLENRRLFLECWGPRVQREYRLARLRRDPFWTDGRGAHIAITLTSLDVRDGWGDWYSGHEIGDALQEQGWRVTYVQRKGDDWYQLPHDLEYVLSLMDPFDLRRVPDHIVTIAWIRNWTERWLERPWFDRADVLLASSAGTAELIEGVTGRRTIRFPLAVNPARFHPQPAQEGYLADYVFTGNWWGKDRDIQQALEVRAGERLAVYGKDWEKVPELAPYARGEIPYSELPAVYASATLVLDDTQGPTLPYGALNARVFDALAAGTLPLTNCAAGVHELFDEDFPVWDSRATLRAQLDRLLGDGERREQLVRRYRETVLTKHTYAHRAAQLREILLEHEQLLSFCLKIGAPNREVAPRWGDLHFAGALLTELRRRGHRGIVQTLDQWEHEDGLTCDVVIHLKGLSRYHPKPGQFNVLWSISHPEGLTGEECDGYDLILVASPRFAQTLRDRTSTPVAVLEQAADPWTMRPDPRPELAHELVYVANSRNILRPIARELQHTERDLAIWGAGWEQLIDTARLQGEHIPNEELRHVYSSAAIVLNDHWDDMREHGYVSNRIYDALACGAFVISDGVPGLTERFGEAVACFDSPQELHELIERFLADPHERARRAQLGRELVLAEHTFAHRASQLLQLLHEHMDALGYRLPLRPGERAAAQSAAEDSAQDGAVEDLELAVVGS
jgi:GT2 family glycosyltransferase/spore maturation protein CgeB